MVFGATFHTVGL